MERPKLKDYKKISGIGAFDYVSDVNKYMDYLEAKLSLPRPLEAWNEAQKLDAPDYIDWYLEQERRGNEA